MKLIPFYSKKKIKLSLFSLFFTSVCCSASEVKILIDQPSPLQKIEKTKFNNYTKYIFYIQHSAASPSKAVLQSPNYFTGAIAFYQKDDDLCVGDGCTEVLNQIIEGCKTKGEVKDSAASLCFFYDKAKNRAVISNFSTNPDHQRKGLGTELFKTAQKTAFDEFGARSIILHFAQDELIEHPEQAGLTLENPIVKAALSAKKLYEKEGFKKLDHEIIDYNDSYNYRKEK